MNKMEPKMNDAFLIQLDMNQNLIESFLLNFEKTF